MRPIVGVRIFWPGCVLLFLAAVVGLRWGVQISIALMPVAGRPYADAEMLHGVWISRSILLFILCAICGLTGIYFSLRASDLRER